jgi:diacylglycerol kinase (ATP)
VASYRSVTYTLDLDGVRTTAPTFMVAFGNGRQYGNGFMLAPAADPADGYLDAMIVADGSVLRQLWRARRLLLAPGAPAHGIRRRRIQRAEIGGPADLLVHADGEPFTAVSPLAVRVEPAALPVAMPPPKAAGG